MTEDHLPEAPYGKGQQEPIVHKVSCFILRKTEHGSELLLFRHPHAGIQIPAGTANPDEEPQVAALREAGEESGLDGLRLVRWLGDEPEPPAEGHLLTAYPTTVYSRPDTHSFDWAHFRGGITVKSLRHSAGFTQVSYEEADDYDHPSYVTYHITGWVPDEALTHQRMRHFYLFEYSGESAEQWQVDIDNHRFELFWARLSDMPPIVAPQDSWLKWLAGID